MVRSLPLVGVALVCGAALSLAFPPLSIGPLSLVALVPILALLMRRERTSKQFFWVGYAVGAGFFFCHLYWITDLLPASSITLPWLMFPALALLVAYLSLFPALAFLLTRKLSRGKAAGALFVFPALWTLSEVLRSRGELGFPWGAIGYSTVRTPALMQSASVGGVFGIGLGIVAVNALIAGALLARDRKLKVALFVMAIVIVGTAFMGGRSTMRRYADYTPVESFRVAVAQPNVDLDLKWEKTFKDSTFRLIEKLSRDAARFEPVLLVFPETCATTYIRYDEAHYQLLQGLAQELNMAIYIGFLDGRHQDDSDELSVFNSSGIFLPSGAFAQYDKRHLLPFGEAIPWAWRLPVLSKINFGQANFARGPDHGPVSSPVGDLAPLICFEAIFSGGARRAVANGAEVLLNITNDGWFGESQGPHQHAEMAFFRAVENRRFLLRSANTGVSSVISPAGVETISLGLGRAGVITESIYKVDGVTWYARFGDVPVVLFAVLIVMIGTVAAFLHRA